MTIDLNKLFQKLAWLTILVTIALLFQVGFWLLYPYKPLVINQNPIKIEDNTVYSGGYLIYNVDFCKYTNETPLLSRTFVDSLIYVSSENFPAVQHAIGCQTQKVQIYIPKALPLDTYVLKIKFIYKVNPLKNVTIDAQTEPFTIINN